MLDLCMKIVNPDEVEDIKHMPEKMKSGLFKGMQQAIALAEKTTTDVYLRGKALNRRTGFLSQAIASKVLQSGGKISAAIGTLKYDVPYAALWEFGGKFAARPYLRPSIEDNMNKMLQIIGRSTTEEMNK